MSDDVMEPRKRSASIGPHEMFLLDQWGRQLSEAFGETPYLVGSVARAEREWRDVDVRLPLADDAWLFDDERPAKLRAVNLSVSLWGRQVTGLPIDFQFQPLTEYQAESGPVNPLGSRSKTGWRVSKPAPPVVVEPEQPEAHSALSSDGTSS